jgi:hypothetical protein
MDWALIVTGIAVGVVCYFLGYFMARTYWYSRGHLDGTEDAAKYVQTQHRVRSVEQRRNWAHHKQTG